MSIILAPQQTAETGSYFANLAKRSVEHGP